MEFRNTGMVGVHSRVNCKTDRKRCFGTDAFLSLFRFRAFVYCRMADCLIWRLSQRKEARFIPISWLSSVRRVIQLISDTSPRVHRYKDFPATYSISCNHKLCIVHCQHYLCLFYVYVAGYATYLVVHYAAIGMLHTIWLLSISASFT